MKFQTKAIHAGEKQAHFEGAVTVPIFQTANYLSKGERDYGKIKYIRLSNSPNHEVLHSKLAELEGGEAALVTASGMGAISTTLLTVLKSGDHLLAQSCLYGGTVGFIQRDLAALNISVTWIDVEKTETWKALIRPNTKAIYVESIANPLTTVGELDAISAFAKEHGLISIIDNTIPTPFYFRPLEIGFDLVVHSATKYLNGHSDIVAGAIVGPQDLLGPIKHTLDHYGACLDPHACFLLNRGIKTLPVRMKQHQENALNVAKLLTEHRKVAKVNYPGLETHPNFKTAKRLMSGYSGLLSFELNGGVDEAERFLANLTIPLVAPSLGGVETLITRPAASSHLGLSSQERAKIGITDGLIRVSFGIEDSGDLIEDFKQALG